MSQLLLKVASTFFFALPLIAFQDNQAERLFNNAATFIGAEKYQEALADYQRIIDEFPNSGWADQALLEMGHYYLNIEANHQQALTYYRTIQSKYSEAVSAPAAYYWEAFIIDLRADDIQTCEAAIANLIRMLSLYSENPWRDGALFLLGKLSMKTSAYQQALSYLQRLEFEYPNSKFLPEGLLLASEITNDLVSEQHALKILSRLQRIKLSPEMKQKSKELARILHKFSKSEPYKLDPNFIGNMPKKYNNPERVEVAANGLVAIQESKGLSFVTPSDLPNQPPSQVRDVTNFIQTRDGGLWLLFENRITDLSGQLIYNSLSAAGEPLKNMVDGAMDNLGRLYIVDKDYKDVAVFDQSGTFIKKLGVNKAVGVASFEQGVGVIPNDQSSVILFDLNLSRSSSIAGGTRNIERIDFDSLGNAYVLVEKGEKVLIGDSKGNFVGRIEIKDGSFPFKAAEDIAVDNSGGIYLTDRKGGSVYRFE